MELSHSEDTIRCLLISLVCYHITNMSTKTPLHNMLHVQSMQTINTCNIADIERINNK